MTQTGIFIWYMAYFSATVTANNAATAEKIDALSYQVASLTADKYSQHDAERDREVTAERFANMKQSVEQLKEEMKWLRKK